MALEAVLNGQKTKPREEEVRSTLRFDVDLDSPNDSATNEVYYPDLVSEKTHKHTIDALAPLDDGPESQIAAIAKRLEEKYAPSKKPRKVREEDLVDIGYGYDLNDPFVDDGEVYEDYVPHQVDTMYGGFYINLGNLEFKKAEGLEDLPLKRKQKPSIKKQSSMCTPKTLLASKKIKLAKQQIATSAQRSKNMKKKLSSFQQKSLFPSSKQSNGSSKETKMAGAVTISLKQPSSFNEGNTSENGKEHEPQVSQTPPTFPSDLPPEIESRVKQIESMIEKEDGKLTIKARYAYDSILLEIESECKVVKMKKRSAVYDYLAYRLGMTKGSLMTRIKRTIKKKEAGSVESPLQQFKEALDEVIPAHVAKYTADMAAYESAVKAEQESIKEGGLEVSKDDFVSDSKNPNDVPMKPKKPRKTFKWTPKLKSLLCDVVRQRVETELANRNRTVSGEDVILTFLETTVKPLWPKGWFVKRNLYNITQSVHTELTGYQQKKAMVKKEKFGDIKIEDGSLSIPPLSAMPLPLPLPNEGSTQVSYDSIMESISAAKQSVSSPMAKAPPTLAIVSPKPAVSPGAMATVTANLKPTLVSSVRQIVGTPLVLSTDASSPLKMKTLDKQKLKLSKTNKQIPGASSPKKDKVIKATPTSLSVTMPTSSGGTQYISHIIQNPVIQSSSPSVVTTPTRKPVVVGTVATTNPSKAVRSPLNMVVQKGPTKVTKITSPPGVVLSKEEIDAIINTLKNRSISLTPQQQLQVLLQHAPQTKVLPLQGQSPVRPSVSRPSPTSPSSKVPVSNIASRPSGPTVPSTTSRPTVPTSRPTVPSTTGVQVNPLTSTGVCLTSQFLGASVNTGGGTSVVANPATYGRVTGMQSKSIAGPTLSNRAVASSTLTPAVFGSNRPVSVMPNQLLTVSKSKVGTVSTPVIGTSSTPSVSRTTGTEPYSSSSTGTGIHHAIQVVPGQTSGPMPAFPASHILNQHNYALPITTPTGTISTSQIIMGGSHVSVPTSTKPCGIVQPSHSQMQGTQKKNH